VTLDHILSHSLAPQLKQQNIKWQSCISQQKKTAQCSQSAIKSEANHTLQSSEAAV